jgi:hypothetical protein
MSVLENLFGKKKPVKIKRAVALPSVTKKVAVKKAPVKKSVKPVSKKKR